MPPIEPIIVVSGLPRSGTSMMMQVLEAGGIPAVTDQAREADASNPRGYFELDAVKRLATDAAFLDACHGKAVKIIAQLLPHLPPQHPYKVIAIHRDPLEVVASQRAMLARLDKPGAPLPDDQLALVLARQLSQALAAVKRLPLAELLELDHAEMIRDPQPVVHRLAAFLERAVDEDAMARSVDPSLHRQRRSAGD